jgi:SAM-dependent methyltransferase/uncharacterized protein YbaR (Trm112 family)
VEVQRKLSIGPDDIVLDVGSGHRPHRDAHVLVDRYPEDDSERLGVELVRDRAFVAADIERLPFRDKAFDYAIASHVLEHTSDPLRAAAELSRVARRGYVEMPSEIWELLFGWEFHTFAVNLDTDGTTVFKKKSRSLPPLGQLFYRLSELDSTLGELLINHPELFYVSVEWEDTLRCRVDPTPWPESLSAASYVDRIQEVRPSLRFTLRTLTRFVIPSGLLHRLRPANVTAGAEPPRRSRRRTPDLVDLLACPDCGASPLRLGPAAASCPGCGRSFVVSNGIPRLFVTEQLAHTS